MNLLSSGFPPINSKIGTCTVLQVNPLQMRIRKQRAEDIAKVLSDNERWHSHSRMISRDTLTSEELRLKIEKIEDSPDLSTALDDYVGLLKDYVQKEQLQVFVHTRKYF